jgi:diguanylate cyclase (GGDEF)-like protein/PAS domain S-box-containing protein
MDYPDNVIPHPKAVDPPIANERIFAADRTFSDHGQRSLSQAFDALAIISATDIRGRITYANEQFVKISGYSEEELLGRSHRIVNSGHHPESFFKEMWQTIVSGATWQGEIKNRAKDGSYYWVNTVIVPSRDARGRIDGYVSVRIDITKEKLAEEALLGQKWQLETALDHMARGFSTFGPDARLVTCNRLYRQIYDLPESLTQPGTPLAEIVRFHMKRETGCESWENFQQVQIWIDDHLARLSRGESVAEVQHLKSGRTVLVTGQALPNGGWVDVQEDITEKQRLEAKIAHMAHHDALTDLPNRSLLDERLAVELARTRRGERLALHILDLDNFKTVNDTLGHPVGDALLRAVATRLRSIARDRDMVARLGGDEFAIVQVGIETESDATGLARRLVDAMAEPFNIGDQQVFVGISIGIALAPKDGDAAEKLTRNADLALYSAKAKGRRTYLLFEHELNERAQDRRNLTADLHKALANHQMELHYQPIIDLKLYQMTGVEALMRWRHPERGLIPPSEFIPIAEETGLIVSLGEWALREACQRVADWPDRIKLALNLSPVQLKRPGLMQTIFGALAASGLPADRLELEVTETVLLEETATNLATLHQLREAGVRIVMDDFGTGYSSLNYLSNFPFDKIKIDHAFIRKIATNHVSLKIVRAIVTLARSLGIGTTAEGVETKEQLEAVRFEGCDEIQGFLISRPQLPEEIERIYLSNSGLSRKLLPDDCLRPRRSRRAS